MGRPRATGTRPGSLGEGGSRMIGLQFAVLLAVVATPDGGPPSNVDPSVKPRDEPGAPLPLPSARPDSPPHQFLCFGAKSRLVERHLWPAHQNEYFRCGGYVLAGFPTSAAVPRLG